MMWRMLLLTVALGACDRSSAKQDPAARDLSRALNPPAEPADTAAQRRRDQLERCKFVYHDEQGLRECLVLKNGWEPQDAAREIAIYKAEIARTVDSLRGIEDSAFRALMRRQREQAAFAARQPYWGLVAKRMYYTNTPNCASLAMLRFAKLRFFPTKAAAEKAGFVRAEEPGC